MKNDAGGAAIIQAYMLFPAWSCMSATSISRVYHDTDSLIYSFETQD